MISPLFCFALFDFTVHKHNVGQLAPNNSQTDELFTIFTFVMYSIYLFVNAMISDNIMLYISHNNRCNSTKWSLMLFTTLYEGFDNISSYQFSVRVAVNLLRNYFSCWLTFSITVERRWHINTYFKILVPL
jgi:hypothetical protein